MKQHKYFQLLNKELVLQENNFSLRLLSTFMIYCKPSKLEESNNKNKQKNKQTKPQAKAKPQKNPQPTQKTKPPKKNQ